MAGSSVIGALRVSLGLDSAQFQSGADTAEKRAYRLGENIGKALRSPIDAATSLKGVIGGLAGALALNELAGATQRAFDYADAIADLSDRTGASTKLIQEFRYAAQLSGSGVDVADEALGKFTRTLGLAQAGGDAQIKLFRDLGVTSSDFDTAFRQTLDGLAKLPSVQQRNAVALQLFGKSASTLTSLLGQGSAGFNELAARANELGIVLQDDVIRNAGQANDQLDTMKMILSAQFANTVAQNANSLVALAQGVGDLTTSLIKFMSSNPETALAIIGAIAGSRAGGLPGAAAGSIAGYAAGTKIASNRDDANGDYQFRRAKLMEARKNRRDALAFRAGTGNRAISLNGDAFTDGANQEFVKQYGLFMKARTAEIERRRAARTGGATGGLPSVGDAEAAADARKAAADAKAAAAAKKRAAEKAAQDEARYQQQVGRARDDELQAQLDLTVNQTERVNLQQALLDNEHSARAEAIQSDRDLTAEQKKQLLLLEDGTYALRAQLLHRRDQEEIARQALDASRAENENQQDVLSAQSRLARTAKERGEIEAKLLDLQFDQLRAVEKFNLDNATRAGDGAGVTAAQNRLKTLGTVQALAQERGRQDNFGLLGSYLNSLPRTADEVNEAFEAVATGGLQSVIDGISDIGSEAKSLKDVFSDVANDIIRSLLRIGLQKGIAALFGSLIGNKAGAPALGLSSGLKADANGLFLSGARAKGGPVVGGKNYLVGEMGPEIFTAPSSGKIIANDDMQSGGRWIIEPSPYFDVRAAGAARPETQAMGVKAAAGGAQIAASDSARRARRRLG
jgi:hypothetical protein